MHQYTTSAALLLLALQLVSAAVDLGQECPGNLLANAGFEEPNTETTKTQIWEPTSNSKWGWYEKIPGVQAQPGWPLLLLLLLLVSVAIPTSLDHKRPAAEVTLETVQHCQYQQHVRLSGMWLTHGVHSGCQCLTYIGPQCFAGWYTARPDGQGNCVKTDWCGTCQFNGKP